METISYSELARRVGDCIRANNLRNDTSEVGFWELVNGSDMNCYKHENDLECEKDEYNTCLHESKDIYQEYIITEGGAEYLKDNTNEIVFYNDKLDLYLWGITHFGTSWDIVYTEIKDN